MNRYWLVTTTLVACNFGDVKACTITGFLLWNADTNTRVDEDSLIEDGSAICREDFQVSFQALTIGECNGVDMSLTSLDDSNLLEKRTERFLPYFLFGDKNDDVYGDRLSSGSYGLSASSRDHGSSLVVSFDVVECATDVTSDCQPEIFGYAFSPYDQIVERSSWVCHSRFRNTIEVLTSDCVNSVEVTLQGQDNVLSWQRNTRPFIAVEDGVIDEKFGHYSGSNSVFHLSAIPDGRLDKKVNFTLSESQYHYACFPPDSCTTDDDCSGSKSVCSGGSYYYKYCECDPALECCTSFGCDEGKYCNEQNQCKLFL